MVNWKDPEVIYHSARAAGIILHCVFAIWAYEFVLTIGYDIAILRGKKRFNWGTALYVLCRYLTMAAQTLSLRTINVMDASVDCYKWEIATLAIAFAAVSCTSGLLYVRVVAVSGRNKYVMWGLGAGYAVIWAFAGIAINKTKVIYLPAPLYICAPIGLHRYRDNMSYPFAYDMVCLGLMLYFLLRERHGGRLWKFLVQQGVVYAVGICSAYLFVIIMVSLDLNDAMSDIGFAVILTVSTICATRMQRQLSEFFERPMEASGGSFSNTKPDPRFAASRTQARERTLTGGVHLTVDMGVRSEDTIRSDWKPPRSFVPDDFEMGIAKVVPPSQFQSSGQTWVQPAAR